MIVNGSTTIFKKYTSSYGSVAEDGQQKHSVLSLSSDQLTPGMKQYQEVKRAHPDCLVMLRMGDFYEMFYEDAITASRELEITLTARGSGDKRAPLAGVPFHALETYLARLIKKSYKVAIVEQLEDPKTAKGLVKRGLVRIVTPGTIIESSLLQEKENNYIIALTSYKDSFALACCDLSTGEFFTQSIEGMPSVLHELVRLHPSECVIPQSLGVNEELKEKVKSSGCFLTMYEDHYFQLEKSRTVLLEHFQMNSLHSFGLEDHPRLISAAGALLQYLLHTQRNALPHIKRVTVHSGAVTMVLDFSTLRNLELVKNLREGTVQGTLLSVVDTTVTPMGGRLLRRWITEPLLQRKAIEARLNAVEELTKKVILREEMRGLLQNMYDLERLIGRINYGTATPRDVVALRHSLSHVSLLKEKLQEISSELLSTLAEMETFEDLTTLLHAAIRDDAPLSVREGGIIKKGFNASRDELEDLQRNSKTFLQELEEQERQKTGISTLKLGFTKVFGYFLEVTRKNVSLVPAHYIRKQTTVNGERYITEELKDVEEKILGAEEKMIELEYALFQEVIHSISARTVGIQEAAQHVAVLDVLCSFARVACERGYIKPELINENNVQIVNGRHPVVEMMVERFIPNTVILNAGEMMIITGPNMSGKSTIMRQTALIVLMAQIGSFVPAERAVLSIIDRIFTRVGAYDDLSSGQSTFMVEMTETASILHNATERSLIILDEIGRGTSTFDGVSIAWSVAEYINHNVRAKTMFSTHYHVLNKLGEKFPKVKNYNVAVKEVGEDVVLLHKLIEGGTDQSYGIHVAKLAGLPFEVVERAKEIQSILEKDDDMMRKIKAKKLEEQKSLEAFHSFTKDL